MPRRVVVSDDGLTAQVIGPHHTTRIGSLDEARRWVAFYRRLAAGHTGRFYRASLAAFETAERALRDGSGAA